MFGHFVKFESKLSKTFDSKVLIEKTVDFKMTQIAVTIADAEMKTLNQILNRQIYFEDQRGFDLKLPEFKSCTSKTFQLLKLF